MKTAPDSPSAPGRLPRTRPRRARRSGLMIIAAVLSLAGVLRLGAGLGAALAEAAAPVEQAQEGPDPAAEACVPAGGPEMLEALHQREALLLAREGEIDDQARSIEVARKALDDQLAALLVAEEELAATLALADQAAEKDVARLVTVYESMKPKDAAGLFAEMAPEFAAGFLGRMRPDAAAAVLAGLDPKKAYSISVMLAGRNADVPTN